MDSSKLQDYLESGEKYSDSSEIYNAIVTYLTDRVQTDTSFDKLIYQYMIKAGTVTGSELCRIIYEQGVLEWDETQYNNLASGATGAYDFLRSKIQSLEITPGQLGLEPCSGSVVITIRITVMCWHVFPIRDMTITGSAMRWIQITTPGFPWIFPVPSLTRPHSRQLLRVPL